MNWKENWSALNAFGFATGAASSLLILSLMRWIDTPALLPASFLFFGLSIGIFQCIPFFENSRLVFRWLLVNSTLSMIGFLLFGSGFVTIFLMLLFDSGSPILTFLVITLFSALGFAFTGFLISNGQTIAARAQIHQARSWVWTITLAYAASGSILIPLFLGIIFIIPYHLSSSILVPIWGAVCGIPSGYLFGLITKTRFLEFTSSLYGIPRIGSE